MRLLRKILNHAFIIVSAGTLVHADPRDLLQEFLERDAVISQRVISREASAGDVSAEREALIGEINGRLAGEGYQLGWTQNFGIEREFSEAKGWKIYPGQEYAYDAESGIASGKGFILSQTFERGIFGDLPIIVGGSYDRANRESALRLNIIHDKTLLGPLVTKHLNTQVFAPEAPIEGSEVTVQFLNGAYQPLQVCARILSAGVLIPKVQDRSSILSHLVFCDDFPLPREEETFALMPQLMDKYKTRFWGVEPSDLYAPAGLVMPKFPLYHPYHPFLNVTEKDDILQIPLAMPFLNCSSMVPLPLLRRLSGVRAPITPFFVVQTLPYGPGTDVIARYQYGYFLKEKAS